MLIWILAGVLFVALGVIGFYQGALRVAFSFVGIIVAALLAMPLSGVFRWLLGLFNVDNPVLLAFLCPVIAFAVVLICFKAGGLATHKKVDTWFKYKASDTVRLLYERMNARVGIAVGMLNAFAYLILLSVVIYIGGYFFIQTRTEDKDGFWARTIANFAEDLRETKMDQAVAAFVPQTKLYWDSADVIAVILKNPLLQNRLSTYPPFLMLSEQTQYKQMGQQPFQDFWQKNPSIQEFRSHAMVMPLVESKDWWEKTYALVGNDLTDLKTYLETGKSPKYDDEPVLGRWRYDKEASYALALKRRPNMPLQQRKLVSAILRSPALTDATLTVTVDNKIHLKLPNAPGGKGGGSGTWEAGKGGTYPMELSVEDKTTKLEALVTGRTMTFTKDGLGMVFEK